MYFRARYYDTSTGEFCSRDLLEYVDGMSMMRGYMELSGLDSSGTNTGPESVYVGLGQHDDVNVPTDSKAGYVYQAFYYGRVGDVVLAKLHLKGEYIRKQVKHDDQRSWYVGVHGRDELYFHEWFRFIPPIKSGTPLSIEWNPSEHKEKIGRAVGIGYDRQSWYDFGNVYCYLKITVTVEYGLADTRSVPNDVIFGYANRTTAPWIPSNGSLFGNGFNNGFRDYATTEGIEFRGDSKFWMHTYLWHGHDLEGEKPFCACYGIEPRPHDEIEWSGFKESLIPVD